MREYPINARIPAQLFGLQWNEQPVLHEQVTLSHNTIATIWRDENLGELPHALVGVAYWLDEDEQRRARQQALAELREHGLAASQGISQDFRIVLETLARPTVEFYGWIASGRAEFSALVAARDQAAVLAIHQGNAVRLYPASPDDLPAALIDQMPQVPAGRGRAISLPEAELQTLIAQRTEAPKNQLPAEAFAVFSRLSQAEDAQELFAMLELPHTGGGELYTAVRDDNGQRQRCAYPINYADTEQGRWMSQLSGDNPHERWLAVAPASRARLIAKLQEMRDELSS